MGRPVANACICVVMFLPRLMDRCVETLESCDLAIDPFYGRDTRKAL